MEASTNKNTIETDSNRNTVKGIEDVNIINRFNQVYRLYNDKIYNYALLLTQCEDQAEDIAQEVFVRVWVEKERLLDIEYIKSYMYKIARNKIIDCFRRNQREQCILKDLEGRLVKTWNTDEEIDERELRKIMTEAIAKLPRQRKAVYSLGKIYGWKREEISQALGISPTTVRTQMTKAIKFVRTYIDGRIREAEGRNL